MTPEKLVIDRSARFGVNFLPPRDKSWQQRKQRSEQMLFRALNTRDLVAFVGSGAVGDLKYPDWEELTLYIIKSTNAVVEKCMLKGMQIHDLKQKLSKFKAALDQSSTEFLYYIESCKNILDQYGPKQSFEKIIKEGISPKVKNKISPTLSALVDLPIKRFITTNYDTEIERTLYAQKGIDPFNIYRNPTSRTAFGTIPGNGNLSFTQEREFANQHIKFASPNLPEQDYMVFHCHGRIDRINSCILTETDYQRWYLSYENESFLRIFNILLSSNPILFVGFSMTDQDFVRNLRRIVAKNPSGKESRPIIALIAVDHDEYESMEKGEFTKKRLKFDQFYLKYGLHCIPFQKPKASNEITDEYETKSKLIEINKNWKKWHNEWLEKPSFTLKSKAKFENHPDDSQIVENANSDLISLLGNKAEETLLVNNFVSNSNDEELARDELYLKLTHVAPHRRSSRLVKFVLDHLNQSRRSEEIQAYNLLLKISIFDGPIPEEIVAFFLRAKKSNAIDCLLKFGLIKEVNSSKIKKTSRSFILPQLIRKFIFGYLHGGSPPDLENSCLSGFTSGAKLIYPGNKETYGQVTEWIDSLIQEASALLNSKNKRDNKIASKFVKVAYNGIRARMQSNSVPLWCDYKSYLERMLNMLNLIKKISTQKWSFFDAKKSNQIINDQAIFSMEEISWIYNDIGLALGSRGNMIDCYSMWEQGLEINKILGKNLKGKKVYELQSMLHLGHTFIELGWLKDAKQYLEECETISKDIGNLDYLGRTRGYLALIHHLGNDLLAANRLYREAIELLREGQNTRALSKFLTHWGDALMAQKNLTKAKKKLNEGISIAQNNDHKDLVAYATNSMGHLYRISGNEALARMNYSFALKSAEDFGIKRLEADVTSELSRLSLEHGDYARAIHLATESLKLANQLNLGLRKTHAMAILGMAHVSYEKPSLGKAFLDQAKELAKKQQYWSRYQEISSYQNQNSNSLKKIST